MPCSTRIVGFAAAALLALVPTRSARADGPEEAEHRLSVAKLSLVRAIDLGAATCAGGVPFHAELELDQGRVVFSIDLAKGKRTVNVVLDAADGNVIATEEEDEDRSAAVEAAKVTLREGIARALAAKPGKAVEARLSAAQGTPLIAVRILAGAELAKIVVDAISGEFVIPDPAPEPARKTASKEPVAGVGRKGPDGRAADAEFTSTFVVPTEEWASRGVNPFFDLRPGVVLVLEGKEDGADVRLEITVLDETMTIDGVETRVVEERETVGGAAKEVSRNYFALSKRTNDVYYFGEDVDEFEAGRVTGHSGSWRSGVAGAKFGLMLPGSPLLGARFQEEVAPMVAMDRAEVESLAGITETATGTIGGCLVIKETTTLEPGHAEMKAYARGIGIVRDGALHFVSRTEPK